MHTNSKCFCLTPAKLTLMPSTISSSTCRGGTQAERQCGRGRQLTSAPAGQSKTSNIQLSRSASPYCLPVASLLPPTLLSVLPWRPPSTLQWLRQCSTCRLPVAAQRGSLPACHMPLSPPVPHLEHECHQIVVENPFYGVGQPPDVDLRGACVHSGSSDTARCRHRGSCSTPPAS